MTGARTSGGTSGLELHLTWPETVISSDRCEGAAWLSSARAVRCRLKCHNERNPCHQLLTVWAEDSDETAIARCEEGRDDVKSARPLRPGLHTCYNGRYSRQLPGDGMPIRKASLSSDWSLQPDSTKLDSLVIAHQPRRGEYVPGPSFLGLLVDYKYKGVQKEAGPKKVGKVD